MSHSVVHESSCHEYSDQDNVNVMSSEMAFGDDHLFPWQHPLLSETSLLHVDSLLLVVRPLLPHLHCFNHCQNWRADRRGCCCMPPTHRSWQLQRAGHPPPTTEF